MRDLDIRTKIKSSLLQKYYQDPNSRIVDEMNVCHGDARVDIAVINGSLHGFEIKSQLDTLSRLPGQIHMYSKIFDYLTIVSGPKHIAEILAICPDWCGVIVANYKKNNSGLKLKKIRPSKRNQMLDKYSLAQLLWKSEVIQCLTELGITRGISNKSKALLWQMLSSTVDQKTLSIIVRQKLKTRANWRSDQQPSGNDDYFQLFSK